MKLVKHLPLCAFLLSATSAFAQFPLAFGLKAGVPVIGAFSALFLRVSPEFR